MLRRHFSSRRSSPNPRLKAPLYLSRFQTSLRIVVGFVLFFFFSFLSLFCFLFTLLNFPHELVARFQIPEVPPLSPPKTHPKSSLQPSCDPKRLRALPLTSGGSGPLRGALPPLAPPRKRLSASRRPKPRPLQAYWPLFLRSPASSASSPPPGPASLVFIPPVTRGSGKPKVGGAKWREGKGGGKRAESERHRGPLFPQSDSVLDCSEQPLYCGIAAPCRRRSDPRGSSLTSASCCPQGCSAIPRNPTPSTAPIASSSILQFKMAAAAAAAAAMAPPGCPGSCPNFAVVCSFLERYGPLLDLPELPFPELERVLQAPPPDVGSGEGKRGARTPGGKRPWHAPSPCSSRTSRASAALSFPRGAAPAGPASPPSPQGLGQRGGGAETP